MILSASSNHSNTSKRQVVTTLICSRQRIECATCGWTTTLLAWVRTVGNLALEIENCSNNLPLIEASTTTQTRVRPVRSRAIPQGPGLRQAAPRYRVAGGHHAWLPGHGAAYCATSGGAHQHVPLLGVYTSWHMRLAPAYKLPQHPYVKGCSFWHGSTRCRLTLPSRGCPKGYAFRSPLMSNVRRHEQRRPQPGPIGRGAKVLSSTLSVHTNPSPQH